MYNYRLHISYDGAHFSGSQIQRKSRTVESVLLSTLKTIFKDLEKITFSGRTDAGVHALEQVINFHSSLYIEPSVIKTSSNKKMTDIQINNISFEKEAFHARKSAIKREYYYVFTDEDCPFHLRSFVSKVELPIDIAAVNRFLNLLIGEHDFTLFRKTGSYEKHCVRKIYQAKCIKFQHKLLTDPEKSITLYRIEIVGNAFLYRMVRNIVGCFFEMERPNSKFNLNTFKEAFKSKNKLQYKPAAANGLILNKIMY